MDTLLWVVAASAVSIAVFLVWERRGRNRSPNREAPPVLELSNRVDVSAPRSPTLARTADTIESRAFLLRKAKRQ